MIDGFEYMFAEKVLYSWWRLVVLLLFRDNDSGDEETFVVLLGSVCACCLVVPNPQLLSVITSLIGTIGAFRE